MSGPFSVGVIGAGGVFESHLEAIRLLADLRVIGICDIDPARRSTRAEALGCPGHADYRALLADRPDVAVVLLPHDLHHAACRAALRAGCNVVVEKPMALDVAQCNEMLAAARRAGRALVVADAASSVPGAVLTGRRFREGSLGRFLAGCIVNVRRYFESWRPSWFLDPSRSGGGMFANLGVHRLALARACLPGLAPAAVSASVERIAGRPVEACTSALVRYAGGGAMLYEETGYVPRPSWLSAGIHLVFEAGIVGWDERAWRLQRETEEHEEQLPPRPIQYRAVYEELLACLRGAGPAPSAEGGALDVAVVEAAYRSARVGREIDLSRRRWRISRA